MSPVGAGLSVKLQQLRQFGRASVQLTTPTRNPFRVSRSRSSGEICCSSISSHSFSLTVGIAEREADEEHLQHDAVRRHLGRHQRRLALLDRGLAADDRQQRRKQNELSPAKRHETYRKTRMNMLLCPD